MWTGPIDAWGQGTRMDEWMAAPGPEFAGTLAAGRTASLADECRCGKRNLALLIR